MAAPGTACEQKLRLETELQVFIDRWSRDPSIKKIILFGSAARDELRCDSDLDLIVVQETDKKFLSCLEPFYRDVCVAMDILVYTPEEFAAMKEEIFLKNALLDGVVVYEAGMKQEPGTDSQTRRNQDCQDWKMIVEIEETGEFVAFDPDELLQDD